MQTEIPTPSLSNHSERTFFLSEENQDPFLDIDFKLVIQKQKDSERTSDPAPCYLPKGTQREKTCSAS